MATTGNGQAPGSYHPAQRLRFDDLGWSSGENDPSSRGPKTPATDESGQDHSGRRFVIVAGLVLLTIWGGLYLAFASWRAKYRERAAYGALHVVSAIDPLKAVVPPGTEPQAWRDAVLATQDMLRTVVGSNLLDVDKMDKLRNELDQSVKRVTAHPESGRDELATIWNEMADRAEFLFQDSRSPTLDRHPRPKILPPRPAKTKDKREPPFVDRSWPRRF
jgi:hypothetical protein